MGLRLANALREWMNRDDLTEDDVGRVFGVHQSTAHRWLDGVSPGSKTVQQIADHLDVSAETLIDTDADITSDSVGLAVQSADDLRNRLQRFAAVITVMAERDDLADRDRKILLITADGLIETIDELRPSLTHVVDHLKNLPSN